MIGAVSVKRFDRGELRKPTVTREGWLRVDAYLTRTGVFTYLNYDGSVRKELRLDEEVFNADSLDSFQLLPLTDDHPPEALDSGNAKQYTAGVVGENVKQDNGRMLAQLLVTDGALVAKMQAGKREISCGYTCDLDYTPGEHKTFGRYDAIQRNIRGNHVAVVEIGRAGPTVRAHMDSADGVMVASDSVSNEDKPTMKKITIDGVEYEVSESCAQAYAKADAARSDAASKLSSDLEKAKARADAAEADVKRKDGEIAALPAKIRADVSARMTLENTARKHLSETEKFDGKSDRDVKVAVLAKLTPEFKADGQSDVYVDARFDIAVESASKASPALDAARAATTPVQTDAVVVDSAAARTRMIAANREMWKKDLK